MFELQSHGDYHRHNKLIVLQVCHNSIPYRHLSTTHPHTRLYIIIYHFFIDKRFCNCEQAIKCETCCRISLCIYACRRVRQDNVYTADLDTIGAEGSVTLGNLVHLHRNPTKSSEISGNLCAYARNPVILKNLRNLTGNLREIQKSRRNLAEIMEIS